MKEKELIKNAQKEKGAAKITDTTKMTTNIIPKNNKEIKSQNKKSYQLVNEKINVLSWLSDNMPLQLGEMIIYNGLQAKIVNITSRPELNGLLYISKDINDIDCDMLYHKSISDKPIYFIDFIAYVENKTWKQGYYKAKKELEKQQPQEEPVDYDRLHEDTNGIYINEKDKDGNTIKTYITDFKIKIDNEYRCIDDNNLNTFETIITSCRVPNYTITRVLNGNSMNDIQSFKNVLNDGYCTFLGNKIDHLNKLKQYIFNGLAPVSKTVSFGGLRKIDSKWAYIESNRCLIDKMVSTSYTVEQTIPHINTNILDYEPITQNELKELQSHLFAFNCPKNVYNLLGYAVASLYKEKLREHDIRIPHLMVIGEAGSGKTQTLNNVLFPLWGLNSAFNSNDITPHAFNLYAMSNTTAPIILDEYKPYMMTQNKVNMISGYMRATYDSLQTAKGTKNQGVRIMQGKTNLVLIGEAGTDETAILERSVTLRLSKRDTLQGDQSEHFRWLCENKQLLSKLARLLIEDAINKDSGILRSHYTVCLNNISSEIKDDRVRKALAFVNFGLFMLCDTVFPSLDIISINQIIASSRIEEQGEQSKSIVDLTLEAIDDAMPTVERNSIDNYRLYQTINNGEQLALNIKAIYPLFTKYVKDYNTGFNPLSQREFVKMLKISSYYVGYKAVKFKFRGQDDTKTNKARAYVLKISEVKKLELDNLLK